MLQYTRTVAAACYLPFWFVHLFDQPWPTLGATVIENQSSVVCKLVVQRVCHVVSARSFQVHGSMEPISAIVTVVPETVNAH